MVKEDMQNVLQRAGWGGAFSKRPQQRLQVSRRPACRGAGRAGMLWQVAHSSTCSHARDDMHPLSSRLHAPAMLEPSPE